MEEDRRIDLDSMTPSQIVKELDKYVIGQEKAKRTIAVALRNRTRRKQLPEEIRDEVSPKNIIMIGATGVGKTEIARRISKLFNAPFVKVEATKFTEVGYVGRDVDSMIRDLMGAAVQQVNRELAAQSEDKVKAKVEDKLLDLLQNVAVVGEADGSAMNSREQLRTWLREGKLEEVEVELTAVPKPSHIGIEVMGNNPESLAGFQEAMNSLGSIFQNMPDRGGKKRKFTVKKAREMLTEQETERSVDHDKAVDIAKERVESMGIVFIDEIDKIAGKNNASASPDVSREGVQRDILPIVEGSKVSTKWGIIDTTHILFIAAGAFHVSKPSDLIPELQGRFPLRVELSDLKSADFYRILKEPENAITKQYTALLATEGVNLEFSDDAIRRLGDIAYEVNSSAENIGARRLYTIMETLLEDVSFNADQLKGQTISVTPDYVDERLRDIIKNQDLSRYIL